MAIPEQIMKCCISGTRFLEKYSVYFSPQFQITPLPCKILAYAPVSTQPRRQVRTRISTRPDVFFKKGVFRNFAKFTGKRLCQSLFFDKIAGFRSSVLLKKILWHRCFPVNFVKFFRTPFLTEHLRWLLLFFKYLFVPSHTLRVTLFTSTSTLFRSSFLFLILYLGALFYKKRKREKNIENKKKKNMGNRSVNRQV